jgi:hypothetical protein
MILFLFEKELERSAWLCSSDCILNNKIITLAQAVLRKARANKERFRISLP